MGGNGNDVDVVSLQYTTKVSVDPFVVSAVFKLDVALSQHPDSLAEASERTFAATPAAD
jgi:hypothetical protein